MRYIGLIILFFVVSCKGKFKVASDGQIIGEAIITKEQSKSIYLLQIKMRYHKQIFTIFSLK